MKEIVNFLKIAFITNKKIFSISLLIIVVLVIVGCTTGQSGISAPSGPIGRGCG